MTDSVPYKNVSYIASAITDVAYVWRDSVCVSSFDSSSPPLLPTTTFVKPHISPLILTLIGVLQLL
jgi:hypothetical protein